MLIWISSDSDSSDDDDEAELSPSPALRSPDAPGPSTLAPQDAADERAAPSTYSLEKIVEMGFPRQMVLKGINEIAKTSGNGGRDENTLVELLLTYKALDDYPLVGNNCSVSCCCMPQNVKDDEEYDDSASWHDDNDDACVSDGSDDEDL